MVSDIVGQAEIGIGTVITHMPFSDLLVFGTGCRPPIYIETLSASDWCPNDKYFPRLRPGSEIEDCLSY